jgi:hypothetical protein
MHRLRDLHLDMPLALPEQVRFRFQVLVVQVLGAHSLRNLR